MPANLNTLGSRYFHSYAGDHQADWKEKTGKFCNFFGRVAFGKKIVINQKDYNVKVAHLAQKIFAGMAAVLLSGLCLIGTALLKASKSHRQAYERVINIEKIKKHTLLKSASEHPKNEQVVEEQDELCKKAQAGLKPVNKNNTKMSPSQKAVEQFVRKVESNKLFNFVISNLNDGPAPAVTKDDNFKWESDEETPSNTRNSSSTAVSNETKEDRTSLSIFQRPAMKPSTANDKELNDEFEKKLNEEFKKRRRVFEGADDSIEEEW